MEELREAAKRKSVDERDWRNDARNTSYFFLNPWFESFFLNGYEIPNPLGMGAENIRAEMLLAAVDAQVVISLQRALSAYGFNSFRFFAAPLLLTKHVAPFLDHKSGLVVDIGGETTTILFLSNGFPRSVIVYDNGSEKINKSLAQEMHLTPQQAEEIKRDGVAGVLPKGEQTVFLDIASRVAREWARGFLETLTHTSDVEVSFSRILLVGGGSAIEQYHESLRTALEGWGSFLLSSPDISTFSPIELSRPFDPQGLLTLHSDIILASMIREVWNIKKA